MTNPRGRSFISYRRSASDAVRVLVEAHHDHGIPTWQDVDNLDEGPTEDQLRSILRDAETANGVMWLTSDVRDSKMIMEVEAPDLLSRARQGDAFFLVPVATGGLDYESATTMFTGIDQATSLATWNVRKVDDASEAAQVATRSVLDRRIKAIHAALDPDEPLTVGLYIREPAPDASQLCLTLDWSSRFPERVAPQQVWNDFLLPALRAVATSIHQQAPTRRVLASGLPSVPAAIALGRAFPAIHETKVEWRQRTPGREDQLWSVDATPSESGFTAETRADALDGSALAVMVSVTESVSAAVAASHATLPKFRAKIEIERTGQPPHDLENPGQAVDLAKRTVVAIRQARIEYHGIEDVHIFAAVPFGVAMMIGQMMNTIGPVQTYEHLPVSGAGRYAPGCRIVPI
jgi:hypothetical protein